MNCSLYLCIALLSTVDGWTTVPNLNRGSTSLFYSNRGRDRRSFQAPVKKRPPMNEELTVDEMRVVIATKGKDEQLGVMSRYDALTKAEELGGLDLIMINPNSDPPVCKIVDYSKYRYMKEKKAKELKKNSKASEVKEVKMSYKIDTHDLEVRVKNAKRFLMQGNRVKLTIMFKGRELQHEKLGRDLLYKLADEMADISTVDLKPRKEGRSLSCFVSPRAEVLKEINRKKRADEKAAKKEKESRFLTKDGISQDEDSISQDEDFVKEDDFFKEMLQDELIDNDDDEDLSIEDMLEEDRKSVV